MSSSTIPYCAVEERKKIKPVYGKTSNDYEKEIYRKFAICRFRMKTK